MLSDAWVVVGNTGVLWRAPVEQSSRTLAWFSVMHKCCKFLSDSTTTSPQLVIAEHSEATNLDDGGSILELAFVCIYNYIYIYICAHFRYALPHPHIVLSTGAHG